MATREAGDGSNLDRFKPPPRKRKRPPAKKRPQRQPSKKAEMSPKAQEANERKRREREAATRVQVYLRTFHNIGEMRYGPGTSWIPQGLLLTVLEMDRIAVEAENALFTTKSGLIVSNGRGGQVRGVLVANANFDPIWAGENPPIFDQVSGRNMDVGQGPRF